MRRLAAAAMRTAAGAVGAILRHAQHVGDLAARDNCRGAVRVRRVFQTGTDRVDDLFAGVDGLVSDMGHALLELLAFDFIHGRFLAYPVDAYTH